MQSKSFADVYSTDFLANWQSIKNVRKPIIAAVSGYALGGGAELALMCVLVIISVPHVPHVAHVIPHLTRFGPYPYNVSPSPIAGVTLS